MEKNYCEMARTIFKDNIKQALNMSKRLLNQNLTSEEPFYRAYAKVLYELTNSNVIHKNNFFSPSVKINMIMSGIMLYTDFYKRLNYLEKMGLIEEDEKVILSKLKSIDNYDKLLELLVMYPIESSLAILRFDTLSAYDKVLEIKALDQEDIDKISKYNPFFMDEYNKYNVKVDENFLARQIQKWLKSFNNDYEKSYLAAAKFLENYSNINAELKLRIEQKYVAESLKDSIKSFYTSDDVVLYLKK